MSKHKKKVSVPVVEKSNPALNPAYIIIGLLCVIFIYLCFNTRFVQDDAFITFRYVENFVSGHGLVFNEGERVEGYTNFLWLLLLSIFSFLKLNIINTAQYLSVLFGVVILIITYLISSLIPVESAEKSKRLNSKINERDKLVLNLLPVLFLTFLGAFNYWAVSGMESTMFTALFLATVYYYFKTAKSGKLDIKISIFLLLGSLTRPEGLYLFGLILMHFIGYNYITYKSEGTKAVVSKIFSKENILMFGIFVVPLALYFLFRISYYGYPFPNTYYAKTGFSMVYFQTGIEYVWNFFKSYLLFGVIFVLPFFLMKIKYYRFHISLLLLVYTMFTIYIVYIGGDVLQLYRFFIPVAPLIFIGFGKILAELYKKFRSDIFKSSPTGAIFAIVAISILITFYNYQNEKDNIERVTNLENGLVEKMKLAGTWFNQKSQQEGRKLTIAATTIGAVSFYAGYNVSVIDMLGLTDEVIAHKPEQIPEISKGYIGWKERNYNAGYVLSRKPDYIYFSTGIKPSAYAERALFTIHDFLKDYYPDVISIPAMKFTDFVYKRKSDKQIQSYRSLPENPNYDKSFINHFTGGLNLMKDQSKYSEAIREFEEAIRLGPTDFGLPHLFLGEVKLRQGDKEAAKLRFSTSTELNDFLTLGHYYLYSMYMEEGDTVKANQRLSKIKEYSPGLIQQ